MESTGLSGPLAFRYAPPEETVDSSVSYMHPTRLVTSSVKGGQPVAYMILVHRSQRWKAHAMGECRESRDCITVDFCCSRSTARCP